MKLAAPSKWLSYSVAAVLMVAALLMRSEYSAYAQPSQTEIAITGAHSTFEQTLIQPTDLLHSLALTDEEIEQAFATRPRIAVVGAGFATNLSLKSFTDFEPPKSSVTIAGAGSARNPALVKSTGPLDIHPAQSAVAVVGAGSAREVALADPLAPATSTAIPVSLSTTPPVVSPTAEAPATGASEPAPPLMSPGVPDGIEMIAVPAGNFTMGSSDADIQAALDACNAEEGNCEEDWFAGEKPSRNVFVDSFEIGKYEVTNAQYQMCVDAGVCEPAGRSIADASIAFDRRFFDDNFPVVGVSWNDATTFCKWIGGRLPTEEEWEKAARGANGQRRYPWGNEHDPVRANISSGFPAAVGSYAADVSPYGVLDMAGNVVEWTETAEGDKYIVRGGGWSKFPFRGRVADRGTKLPPDFANYDVGFRCAK